MNKKEKIIEEVVEKNYWTIFKDWVIKNSKLIITILIILIVLILSGKIIKYINSPEYAANKYFKAIANNNYEEIYKLIDVDDSKLVSKKVLKDKISKMNVDAYKIDSVQVADDNALVTYKYEYKNKINYASVLLRKSMKNKLLLFNNWKIQSSKVVNNITIKVPVKSIVKIDNIDIKEYLKESTEDYDFYKIDEMISGKYKINIELQNGLKTEDEIEVKSDTTYLVGNIELEESIKEDVKNQLNNSLNILYSNAIENKNYDETGLNNLKNEYLYLKDKLNIRGYSLIDINFNDIDINSATYDTMLKVTFNINYNYHVELTNVDDVMTSDGNILTNITANFKEVDGKYILDSIDNLPVTLRVR